MRTKKSDISFDLELITDADPNVVDAENNRKRSEVGREVRHRVSEYYPKLRLSDGLIIGGSYGGDYRGSALYGETDVKTFKEVFGDSIEPGASCLLTFFGVPVDLYVKWYQVGELHVPDRLKDVVKGVYISRSPTGGEFGEVNLWVPKKARKYAVQNELEFAKS